MIGLAQKVLIADEVARIAEAVFDKVGRPSFVEAWLGLVAYTIQIYFDFAGYSNMAIGLGLALGFAFPRNFRLPYTSRSITEFWRRWHISLSQWLRDYLYIPLGGSRRRADRDLPQSLPGVSAVRPVARRELDLRDLGRASRLLPHPRARRAARPPRAGAGPAARLYALVAVMTGWVWFRARDVDHALAFFGGLIGIHGWSEISMATHAVLHPATLATGALGVVLATTQIDFRLLLGRLPTPMVRPVFAITDTLVIGVFFCLAVLSVAAGSYSPFLYFRF